MFGAGIRIVLTGATGFAGSATLTHLLADDRVQAVTVLSRRPLTVGHPTLTVHLQQDFGAWDTTLLRDLAEHDACVWALGAKASDVTDPERYWYVTHDCTLALAVGLAENNHGHLRFCYLSGMGANPREGLRLPWERQTRIAKGRTERDLRTLAARSRGFHVTCFRLTRPIAVSVADLADALTVVATGAAPGLPDVVHNRDVHRLARATRRGAP